MLDGAWPLFGLKVETPRLLLRLPRDEEIADLSRVAAEGVHEPHERPFLTPWTEGGPEERARFVLQQHWSQLGSWDAQGWRLGLGIFRADQPLGVVTLRARNFSVVREVTTSSWLGLEHQGRGQHERRTGHGVQRHGERLREEAGAEDGGERLQAGTRSLELALLGGAHVARHDRLGRGCRESP